MCVCVVLATLSTPSLWSQHPHFSRPVAPKNGAKFPPIWLFLCVGTEFNTLPRLLSLDGGGVRGLSSLLILREIMEEVGRRKRIKPPPLPCEYFDLIGGTSTGGLIALMLGRLRMVKPVPGG